EMPALEGRTEVDGPSEGSGRAVAALSAMGIAFVLYLVLRHWARVPYRISSRLVDPLVNPLAHLPFPDRLYAGLRLSGRYLFYLLVPLRFGDRVGYYPGSSPHFGPLDPGALLGLTLLALWAGGLVLRRLRRAAACAPLPF